MKVGKQKKKNLFICTFQKALTAKSTYDAKDVRRTESRVFNHRIEFKQCFRVLIAQPRGCLGVKDREKKTKRKRKKMKGAAIVISKHLYSSCHQNIVSEMCFSVNYQQ